MDILWTSGIRLELLPNKLLKILIIKRNFLEPGLQQNKIIFMYFCYRPCNMLRRGVWGPPSNLGHPVIQGSKIPSFSLSIYDPLKQS